MINNYCSKYIILVLFIGRLLSCLQIALSSDNESYVSVINGRAHIALSSSDRSAPLIENSLVDRWVAEKEICPSSPDEVDQKNIFHKPSTTISYFDWFEYKRNDEVNK